MIDLSVAFTTSSPETRPAFARAGGTWRVAHADRAAAAILRSSRLWFGDVYAVHESDDAAGRRRVWIGLRNNGDEHHATRLNMLHDRIDRDAVSVRRVVRDGLLVALRITDRG